MSRPAFVVRCLPAFTLCAFGIVGSLSLGTALAQEHGHAEVKPTAITTLKVGGDVEKALELSAADLAKLPRLTVKGWEHDGTEVEYSGVALVEILKLAGVKLGAELRGPRLADYLLVEAADGYKAVFALPEIDPAFTERTIVLADQADGKPLPEKDAPFKIVVPGEKKHGRWVRQVMALSIQHAK